MKILLVVGTFDDHGGRKSSYGEAFVGTFSLQMSGDYTIWNGGKFDSLLSIDFRNFDLIVWFANVPNDKPKLVSHIKEVNPKCLLVTSKRNDASIDEKKPYGNMQLIAHALKNKSNLLVEYSIWEDEEGRVVDATILDPLGNIYGLDLDLSHLVSRLVNRIKELLEFTRVSSKSIGERINPPETIELSDFYKLVQQYGLKFHDLIHITNDRFMGNASFRCENGFPSFRADDLVFVSKRNIDKREIGSNGFVACSLNDDGFVGYYGDEKPSVDTPIQLALYRAYPRIRYMIHSHTYVEGAPRTKGIIPCGSLEEVGEICKLVPSTNCNWFFVNLSGHGSLCAAESLDMLDNIPYVARNIPELRKQW
jgi:hypothetical protein